jgi:hypothetical protein
VARGWEVPETRSAWRAETVRIVGLLRSVLDDLGCDDLRWLPDAASLAPLVDLLLRFPILGEREDGRPLLRAVLLSLLLHPDRSGELHETLATVAADHHPETLLQGLRDRLSPAGVSYALEEQLAGARSREHRLVRLLYGLLRHRRARDFRYDGLPRCGAPGEERDLAAPCACHRLVPAAELRELFEPDGSRAGHPADDLGNLTWLSRPLCHVETGLGDRPADLENEPAWNRRAHFLDDDTLLDRYADLVRGAGTRDGFERFCSLRRRRIARGMEKWLRDAWDPVERKGPRSRS